MNHYTPAYFNGFGLIVTLPAPCLQIAQAAGATFRCPAPPAMG